MATARRKLILDNIFATLNGLTTYDGETITAQFAAKSWDDFDLPAIPFVGIVPLREDITHEPFEKMRVALQLSLICHVRQDTQPLRSEKLNVMFDDIVAALEEDTTRGCEAIHTTITSLETDEGDDDAEGNRHGDGSMVINVQVVYIRTIRKS